MKELLDTDRVNFLIWRYLIESGLRETAAKLQKEWRIQAPHRHFDFAPHVKDYSLVDTLNKGLRYEDYERQFAIENHQATADTQRGIFGPFKAEPVSEDEEDEREASEPEPEHEDIEPSRKRQALPNGSPAAKRPRLSNGYENGVDSATTAMDAMDLDHAEHNNHAYPSPLEGEQAQSPLPRTQGPDRGTQVEKVYELNQETTFLRLADDSPSETSLARASDSPLVLLGEWNPQDPSILAAAGTDALARVWTVSRATAPDTSPDHVHDISRPFKNLKEDDVPADATISAMAWNWNGTAIALATQLGVTGMARIGIWTVDGTNVHHFDGVEPPVLKLLWSPNNDLILSIGPEGKGALITIFSPIEATSVSYALPDHDIEAAPLDGTWITETEFIICGGDLLLSLQYTRDKIVEVRKFDTGADENSFNQVQFDWRSKLLATSSEKGAIDLWDEAGSRRSISAHLGIVTAIQWQPLQSNPPDDERLLASGGDDNAICIWNVRNPDNKPKFSMTMDQSILALSFTPDGAYIATATRDRIFVWRLGDSAMPRAVWMRPAHPGWLSPSPNGASEDEDYQPCLGWDADGQRLLYGVNSRLAVINFR